MIKAIWVGIDWGTHSSKWWYTAEHETGAVFGPLRVGPVIDSTIHRRGERLVLVRERTVIASDLRIPRIKRCLIEYPLGPSFWDASWEESTGLSLGESSALSLAVILGDAAENMKANGLQIALGQTEVRLCFALPNWVGQEQRELKARRQMFQACAVVGALIENEGLYALPKVGMEVPKEEWHQKILNIRQTSECRLVIEEFPTGFKDLVERHFSLPGARGLQWRLAAESCAAGFPKLERLLVDPAEAIKTEDHWVKLLVVDVGAGSTDIGYLVSSRNRQGQLFFNYLRPAPTLEWAGEKLSEMVRDFYRSKGREITPEEAEILKLNAPDEWKNEEFVKDWIKRIANRVGDYIVSVPDTARLPEPSIPGLKILLTGGSGVVPGLGLDVEVENAVKQALMKRRSDVPTNVVSKTERVEAKLDWPQDPIDQARRAVSIGAGKKTFGELRYREKLEKAVKTPLI